MVWLEFKFNFNLRSKWTGNLPQTTKFVQNVKKLIWDHSRPCSHYFFKHLGNHGQGKKLVTFNSLCAASLLPDQPRSCGKCAENSHMLATSRESSTEHFLVPTIPSAVYITDDSSFHPFSFSLLTPWMSLNCWWGAPWIQQNRSLQIIICMLSLETCS